MENLCKALYEKFTLLGIVSQNFLSALQNVCGYHISPGKMTPLADLCHM